MRDTMSFMQNTERNDQQAYCINNSFRSQPTFTLDKQVVKVRSIKFLRNGILVQMI
jgi:hypothetical protein